MTTLGGSFERELQEALLDDIEDRLLRPGGPVRRGIEASHQRLRAWGTERDYDIEPVIDSLQDPTLERRRDGITARWGWGHPATPYFEFGTRDHTIEGNPILSFVWDDENAPRWVKKEFDREGDGYRVFFRKVEVSGVAETRFIRHGLRVVRNELQA